MWRIFVCIILFKSACSVKHKGESSNNQEQKITEKEEDTIFIEDDEIIRNINTAFPGNRDILKKCQRGVSVGLFRSSY